MRRFKKTSIEAILTILLFIPTDGISQRIFGIDSRVVIKKAIPIIQAEVCEIKCTLDTVFTKSIENSDSIYLQITLSTISYNFLNGNDTIVHFTSTNNGNFYLFSLYGTFIGKRIKTVNGYIYDFYFDSELYKIFIHYDVSLDKTQWELIELDDTNYKGNYSELSLKLSQYIHEIFLCHPKNCDGVR